MTRSECLDAAKAAVTGERERQYGNPEDNFQMIADLWTVLLRDKLTDFLTAKDVAEMMIQFKLARARGGEFKLDNYVDIAGYAACAAEIVSKAETE